MAQPAGRVLSIEIRSFTFLRGIAFHARMWLYDVARAVGGYAGIFVVSILGNLIPFVPIPYLAVVYFYSMRVAGANPLLVGVVSGLGGAVGKMVVYAVGRGSRILLKKESRERYERLGKLLKSYGALAAFIIAATPSPDDAIIIPLGMMKYDALKLFAGLVAGKIVISVATAYAGRAVAMVSRHELLVELVSSIVLFAIVIALLVYVDWERVLEILGDRGFGGLLSEVREEGLAALLRPRAPRASRR